MVSSWSSTGTVKFNRTVSLALCFGVAFLLLAGSALAQTTAVTTQAKYALQVGKVNAVYSLPNTGITRTMGVARATNGNFFIDVVLPSGFQFTAGGLPVVGNLTLSTPGGGTVGVSIFNGGTAGDTHVKYTVNVSTGFTSAPVFTINTGASDSPGGWNIKDTTGVLSGTTPTTLNVQVSTYDAQSGAAIDAGTDTAAWIQSVAGLSATFVSTSAVVDTSATANRKNFVTTGTTTNTLTANNGATLKISVSSTALGLGGAAYTIGASDTVTLTFSVATGTMAGISNFIWNPGALGPTNAITKTVTSTDTSDTLTITTAALQATAGLTIPVQINVDGSTQLTARTIALQGTSVINANASNNKDLVAAGTTFANWTLNGSILVANWANGNSTAFKTRFYLWNASGTSNAIVSVRIFTLPLPGSGNSTQLGATYIVPATMAATSGMTLRLQEDLLTPMGITAAQALGPDGNGNLVVEITIQAPSVSGYTQVFTLDAGSGSSSQMGFGTVDLHQIQ